MDNINHELQQIQANRYGVDIRVPIHDALAKLSGADLAIAEEAAEGFPIDFGNADITPELRIIQNASKGADVKDAIHSALYKLSKNIGNTNYVAAGLTPVEVEVTPISGTPYEDNVISISSSNRLESLGEVLSGMSPNIFGKIEFEEISETKQELRIYHFDTDATPFVTISGVYAGSGTNLQWWYQISVYCYQRLDPTTIVKTVSYPYEIPEDPSFVDTAIITPKKAYVGKRTVLIQMGLDNNVYMIFTQSKQGKLMVSFHCGYLQTPYGPDPRSAIRSFSNESIVNYPSEINQNPEHETDVIAFAPVIPEGDDDYTNRAYIVLRNVGSGTVEFGSKTFYIEGSYMIET